MRHIGESFSFWAVPLQRPCVDVMRYKERRVHQSTEGNRVYSKADKAMGAKCH